MIQLINVTPSEELDKPDAVHTYEIRIKSISSLTIVTTFTHKPDEGLSRCLQKAALAVERKLNQESTRDDWW